MYMTILLQSRYVVNTKHNLQTCTFRKISRHQRPFCNVFYVVKQLSVGLLVLSFNFIFFAYALGEKQLQIICYAIYQYRFHILHMQYNFQCFLFFLISQNVLNDDLLILTATDADVGATATLTYSMDTGVSRAPQQDILVLLMAWFTMTIVQYCLVVKGNIPPSQNLCLIPFK